MEPFSRGRLSAGVVCETEPAMIPEQIENVKSQYTDKYVTVDPTRPELARFRDLVGRVKTVNMSGRALVEFDDYHLNIGWYDIGLDYLKVVDKPAPKEKPSEGKTAPAKPAAKAKPAAGAGEKKLSPLELARMQGAGGGKTDDKKEAKPAAKGKQSTADILAAARGDAKEAPAKEKPAAEKPAATSKPAAPKGKMSTADILAAARGGDASAGAAPAKPAAAATPAQSPPDAPPASQSGPAKVDRSKMSVADMMAMARGETAGGGTTEAPEAAKAESSTEETVSDSATPAAAESAEPSGGDGDGDDDGGVVKVDRSSMSVEEMLAYCREKDAS